MPEPTWQPRVHLEDLADAVRLEPPYPPLLVGLVLLFAIAERLERIARGVYTQIELQRNGAGE